jgi:hypothetical protein
LEDKFIFLPVTLYLIAGAKLLNSNRQSPIGA